MPFTVDQFFDVFRRYNEAIWPAQIALTLIGIVAAFAAHRANQRRSWHAAQIAVNLLALLWLWTGIVYHKVFFAAINPAAEVFGSIFIAEGALLLIWALCAGPDFEITSRMGRIAAATLIGYALILYPALGIALGHHYPSAPTFGTPCPTTIFTFGVFCLLAKSVPRFVMAIPVLWSILGLYATVGFGVGEDAGLLAAAIVTMLVIHHENHLPAATTMVAHRH
jgi:hypothetical protein